MSNVRLNATSRNTNTPKEQMSIAFALLPLALVPCLYAALVKVAAFLFRRTQLRWSHALVYGFLALVVGAAGTLLNRVLGSPLPLPLALLGGLALQLTLGGWYFGPRATTATGASLEFKGGVLLSLVAYGLVFVLGVVVAVVVPALYRAGQA
jgi:hypothetical protein